MIELNEKERKRCNTLDKTIEMIKIKYEKDEVVEEDFEEELINTIKGKYNMEELSEDEIQGQMQFIFSTRLRRLLKEKELKETDLANLIGVQPATITRYLRGDNFPSMANMARICKELEVSPAYLLGLSHIPFLSSWNMSQALGLSIQGEKSKQILEILNTFISNNELDFLNLLNYSKEYIKIKQKLNTNEQVTKENLEEIKNKIQKSIFESLDKMVEIKENEKNERSNLC